MYCNCELYCVLYCAKLTELGTCGIFGFEKKRKYVFFKNYIPVAYLCAIPI